MRPAHAPQRGSAERRWTPRGAGRAVRVLLVDDNAPFRSALRRLLEREPEILVVGEASDGGEALDQAAASAPDVVLMDVSMPGMSGIEATHALKSRLPRVTVLMLSVGDKEHDIQSGLAGGASEYLLKGTPASDIVEAIKRHGLVPGDA